MKTKILLAVCLLLSAGLLSAYDLMGAFQIKTSPRGADVNLVDIDLYLCSTPSPVYPVFMDEYMELREGIPGRSIRVVISKEGYVPIEKTLYVPFLYEDQRDALRYPTVFNFRLTRDRRGSYASINYYYAYNYHRPRPVHYTYFPGYYWYPPPPGGYVPRPPGWIPPGPPPGGSHPGHPGSHGGGINPPGGGGNPGSHGGGSGAPGTGVNPPGGGSGGHGGGYTPSTPPGGGSGGSAPGGYGSSSGGSYTPPAPPSGGSSAERPQRSPAPAPNTNTREKEKEEPATPVEILRRSTGRTRN